MIEFKEESIKDVLDECMVIAGAHWNEVALHRDNVKLAPDKDMYHNLEDQGIVHTVTARDGDKLVGYCISLMMPHTHYKNDVFAFNDALYIDPDYRNGMVGVKLLKKTEEFLKKRGVSVMTVYVKPTKDFSPILKRLGFSELETVYSKFIGE